MKGFFLFIFALLILDSSRFQVEVVKEQISQNQGVEIPQNIKPILETKCYMCHVTATNNKSALRKVNFSTLGTLDRRGKKKFAKRMIRAISKEKMPPQERIEAVPQMELTVGEEKLILNWVKSLEKDLD